MYINGEWLKDGPTFSVYNPATGDRLDEVFDGNEGHAHQAIEAAEQAQQAGPAKPPISVPNYCIAHMG